MEHTKKGTRSRRDEGAAKWDRDKAKKSGKKENKPLSLVRRERFEGVSMRKKSGRKRRRRAGRRRKRRREAIGSLVIITKTIDLWPPMCLVRLRGVYGEWEHPDVEELVVTLASTGVGRDRSSS